MGLRLGGHRIPVRRKIPIHSLSNFQFLKTLTAPQFSILNPQIIGTYQLSPALSISDAYRSANVRLSIASRSVGRVYTVQKHNPVFISTKLPSYHQLLHHPLSLTITITVSYNITSHVCCRLMLGFMITTSFLSMWISNTATTAMMVPIAEAVLAELKSDRINENEEIEQGMQLKAIWLYQTC